MRHTAPFSLETLLTSEAGFGLTTATPAQRAICRITEGLPLGDLATNPDVQFLVGGAGAIDCLPVGEAPRRVMVISAIRCAKTMIQACVAVYASQTVDLSGLKPGEVPRFVLVSLTKDHARVALNFVAGAMQARPALRKLLADDPTGDCITLWHPSGRRVELSVQPVTEAGGSVAARWLFGLGIDELPRQPWDGVVRVQDLITSAQGRILPGGSIFSIGSPWATAGPAYEDYQASYGKPTADLVVLRGTGPMLHPQWWTPERCARLKKTDPRAYKTDVLGEFIDDVSCPFEAEAVEASYRLPVESYEPAGAPVLLMDASAGRGDAFTCAVAQWFNEGIDLSPLVMADIKDEAGNVLHAKAYPVLGEDGKPVRNPNFGMGRRTLVISDMMAFDGRFGSSVTAEQIVSRIAHVARREGARHVVGDAFGAYQFESMFQREGLVFSSVAWTNENKARAVTQLRRWYREGMMAVAVSPDERAALTKELGGFREKLLPSGLVSYGARAGGHDDRVALLINAAIADSEGMLRGSPIGKNRTVMIDTRPITAFGH